MRNFVILALSLALLTLTATVADDPNAALMKSTGLEVIEPGEVPTFGKIHRGYPLRLRIAAGDVWGRFFTRLAVSEATSDLPDPWRTLYFDRPGAGDIAGSRADQAISQVMGYPLTLTVVLEHETDLSPLFLYSSRTVYKPPNPPPEQGKIPGTDLKVYCDDPATAQRVLDNRPLVKRLSKLRAPFIGLTQTRATLMWAGDESQYSEMIRAHKDYPAMFNSIFDGLAELVETAGNASDQADAMLGPSSASTRPGR